MRAATVLYYSHDTYGLGHLRRTLAIAGFLQTTSQLILTGSPIAHRFHFPARTDYIKLPSVLKLDAGRYEPRYLRVPFREVRDLRRDIIVSAARHLAPEVLLVDNVPAGLKGELVPALHQLKAAGARLVLGIRDVLDEAEWVRSAWREDGSYDLIDDLYDLILVYGDRGVYDPTVEYAFSERAAAKTRFVGYLRRTPAKRSPESVRRELERALGDGNGNGARPSLVVVMAGGGGDGYQLLRSVVEAVRLDGNGRSFQCLLVGGPLMPPDDRRRIRDLAAASDAIRYVDFVEDVAGYVAAADAVVSMGGYNSICEFLTAGKAALIVPRTTPRREQLIRAKLLSERGVLRYLHPEDLDPRTLRDEIERLLDAPFPMASPVPLDGLQETANALEDLLSPVPAGG